MLAAQEQENADMLFRLGVLHYQRGEYARAVDFMGRAAALQPNSANFHCNLGAAYRALGQFERAVECCRMALWLAPDFPDALCNLGAALQSLGQHTEAVAHFHRALRLRPDFALVHNNLGLSLHELKQFDYALTHLRRAVELAPDFVLARTNLGSLLLVGGHAELALPHFEEAVRLQPNQGAWHSHLGDALRTLGRQTEARIAYLEAIRLAPQLAAAHAQLAFLLQREGRLNDALPCLKKAVELEPNNLAYWESLATLHSERDEPALAISCCERVLEHAPHRETARLALGWALRQVQRMDEARDHYRIALQNYPNSAEAHLRMGILHAELGEFAEAETAYRKVLRLEPGNSMTLLRLVMLLGGRLPDADLADLERRRADPQLNHEMRAALHYGLAHVLDARGQFAQAAVSARQANALRLEQARRGNREYQAIEHERFIDETRLRFDKDFFARTSGSGSDTRRPVFIIGLPRSGTTLVAQILASHPGMHSAGELALAFHSFMDLPTVLGRSELPLDCVPHLDAAAIGTLAERHLDWLREKDGGQAERIVDKMPDNYLYLGLLMTLFPNATFIHCRRDLRDVAVSCWMTLFVSLSWNNAPEHIASRFRHYRRLLDHWRAVLPRPVHEVRYEDTVSDLEGVSRRLLAVCGLDWSPACLEFHRTKRPIRSASMVQARQPLYRHAVARWQNYERELADLFALLPSEEN